MADTPLGAGNPRANAEPSSTDPLPYIRRADDKILSAFESYRNAFLDYSGAADEADTEPFFLTMDKADDVLAGTSATTIAGAVAKLRRAFRTHVGELWSDDAVLDNRPEEFAHSLELSDLYTRMFWSAIEDLQRLAARAEWDRAMSEYSAAHAFATRKGLTDGECDSLSEAESVAFRTMVSAPAPDLAALKAKMQIGLQHVWHQCHAEPEEIAALLADVARLSGEA